jgi:hypothetical protein
MESPPCNADVLPLAGPTPASMVGSIVPASEVLLLLQQFQVLAGSGALTWKDPLSVGRITRAADPGTAGLAKSMVH